MTLELLLFLKQSGIYHEDARKGVFAGHQMETVVVIGFYYLSVIISDICGQKRLKKTCREGVIAVITEESGKYAFKIRIKMWLERMLSELHG